MGERGVKSTEVSFFHRGISPEDRLCLFEDENEGIKLFNNYSQVNCFLECRLRFAKELLKYSKNSTKICSPWFFPFDVSKEILCSPFDNIKTKHFLQHNSLDELCGHCLPGLS